jgi:predicted nucleic acid-binding protein
MKVLVDTCVWSRVLRYKKADKDLTEKLKNLIEDGRVVIIGPIRQELLSGISNEKQFEELKKNLSAFESISLKSEYFEKAAEFSNICRKNGIQGSTTDFLICAVSFLEDLLIFTIDEDFKKYKKYLPIHIFH